MELPKKPSPVKRETPAKLLIFGKPKCGKTTITSALTLTGDWLLLELERGGADFVSATKIEAYDLDTISEVGKQILAANRPYKGIIVDTVTKLEEMVLPLAGNLYRSSPMGSTWQGTDVRTLPKGAGYLYLREAFFQVVNYISTLADNVIFIGHLADKMIEKNGEELVSKELDLTGKISKLMCADMDAIAYCYREDNKTILNFESSEEVVCGSRCKYLRGQKIVVATSDDKGNVSTFWERIYL